MSTIIAHGKSQWGRANKNKKVDPDEEAVSEIDAILKPSSKSKVTDETKMLQNITAKIEIGEEIVGRLDYKDKTNSDTQLPNVNGAASSDLEKAMAALNKTLGIK